MDQRGVTHLRRHGNQAIAVNAVVLVVAAFAAWGGFRPYLLTQSRT
ncbi:hypothetical protein ACH4E8_34055 [Streptomyces sp. NPDC017979]